MSYRVTDGPPSADTFHTLRAAAGMPPRPPAGVERALDRGLHAVTAGYRPSGTDEGTDEGTDGAVDDSDDDDDVRTVGVARVVGDGGTVYHVCDTVVHPDHQGRGVGTRLMERLLAWIRADAPPGAYVNLLADVDGFYERFGFEESRPAEGVRRYWYSS